MEFAHTSVLLEETIEGLAIKPDGIYVDGTLGGAGHSSHIAARLRTGRLTLFYIISSIFLIRYSKKKSYLCQRK